MLPIPRAWKDKMFHSVTIYGAKGDGVTDDTQAFKTAIATGKNVYVPTGVYKITDLLVLGKAQKLYGEGCDVWDFPSATNGTSKENNMSYGTTLLFAGTPTTTTSIDGVTDCSLSGGVRANPDYNQTEDQNYKLLDYTNKNASGTTPATSKALKVGILISDDGACIEDLRIQLNYNGVDGYNDDTLTGLGDNWDIGILLKNASYCTIRNVQVVGYWRMNGVLQYNGAIGDSEFSEGTFNRYENSCFQGFVGLSFRSPDAFRCTARTSSTIELPWTASSQIPSSGKVWSQSNTTYTYTGTTQSGDKITLTGVTPDPTSGLSVGDDVRINLPNFGVAGTSVKDCVITGLFHASRLLPYNASLGFSQPGAALQISGDVMRDIDFYNCHLFDSDCILHLHNCEDCNFSGCYFEPYGHKTDINTWSGVSGARVICSPIKSANTFATYPAGETSRLVFDIMCETGGGVDFYPHGDRSSGVTRYSNSTGLFTPRSFKIDFVQGLGAGATAFPFQGINNPLYLMMQGSSSLKELRVIDKNFNEKLTVRDDGRVGINTDAPFAEGLDIASGTLLLPDGEAAAPAMRFRTDFDTGIYQPATNEMCLGAGGNEIVRCIGTNQVVTINRSSASSSAQEDGFTFFGNGTAYIHKNGVAETTNIAFYNNADVSPALVGSIKTSSSSTSYNTTSDYRLKENLKDIIAALDLIKNIKIYEFNYKIDKDTKYQGVLAHELQQIFPSAVTGEKDGQEPQAVDYSKLVPILIQGLQETMKRIEVLESKI